VSVWVPVIVAGITALATVLTVIVKGLFDLKQDVKTNHGSAGLGDAVDQLRTVVDEIHATQALAETSRKGLAYTLDSVKQQVKAATTAVDQTRAELHQLRTTHDLALTRLSTVESQVKACHITKTPP
jgi:hypothetical protein